ncbi:TetR/AcrR family transcriptional regulator [Amorphus coralli]|uniref:TetR/AcrR family transcriptional regulator n=1 Tax=Amorphus coralli TaxID=340680 RepID=UPI0003637E67|nr:TetR/AcrR family transcriptional regulator [Amorphus coralli]
MPRVVKHPDARRAELLDCAQTLFFDRGYEATSVADIIAAAGVSKGGFYHHFAAKEDVLTALAERLAREAAEKARPVLADTSRDALTRFNAFLGEARAMKREQAPELLAAFRTLFRPENLVLYQRIHTAQIAVLKPLVADLLRDGTREGTFRVADPEATAEILLHLGASSRDAVADAISAAATPDAAPAAERLEARLVALGVATDRILGLPDGSVTMVEPGFAAALLIPR